MVCSPPARRAAPGVLGDRPTFADFDALVGEYVNFDERLKRARTEAIVAYLGAVTLIVALVLSALLVV